LNKDSLSLHDKLLALHLRLLHLLLMGKHVQGSSSSLLLSSLELSDTQSL